jgi:hypothetical protein
MARAAKGAEGRRRMSMTAAEPRTRRPVFEAVLPYVVPGEAAVFYPGQREKSYWPVEDHVVPIHDAREAAQDLALETNGFVLLKRPTACVNFSDPDEVKRVYYPEIEALVKELTDARRVLIFGDIVRSDSADTPDGRQPARGAHVDYDEATCRMWTEMLAGKEEADDLLKGRFMLMNLWRPIRTVEKTPLALCDASTVEKGDLNPSQIMSGLNGTAPTMSGYNLHYSPRHRWYYTPRMQPDEILAFKLCDSDRGRVQWTGHTAFDDPTSPPDARPRQSIEIRTISFF